MRFPVLIGDVKDPRTILISAALYRHFSLQKLWSAMSIGEKLEGILSQILELRAGIIMQAGAVIKAEIYLIYLKPPSLFSGLEQFAPALKELGTVAVSVATRENNEIWRSELKDQKGRLNCVCSPVELATDMHVFDARVAWLFWLAERVHNEDFSDPYIAAACELAISGSEDQIAGFIERISGLPKKLRKTATASGKPM